MLSRAIPRLRLSLTSVARAASTAPTPQSSAAIKPPVSTAQSPNYPSTWSTSQRPRPDAYAEARFEQAALDLQPQPQSAMEMISLEPIRLVHGRRAVCDGGSGPLGHPKIFVNLDKPGPKPCGYCGIRFEQAPHEHGH